MTKWDAQVTCKNKICFFFFCNQSVFNYVQVKIIDFCSKIRVFHDFWMQSWGVLCQLILLDYSYHYPQVTPTIMPAYKNRIVSRISIIYCHCLVYTAKFRWTTWAELKCTDSMYSKYAKRRIHIFFFIDGTQKYPVACAHMQPHWKKLPLCMLQLYRLLKRKM